MTSSHYDVVVLGARPAPLLCGALLAKRGFRVLVLGHDHVAPTYELGGYQLPCLPFTFVGARSPINNRVLSELRLEHRFRRSSTPLEPAFQLALPDHRLDVSTDEKRFDKEIDREFPRVKRSVEDFHRSVVRVANEFDRVVDRDLVWPPETFLERREFARASAHQPFDRAGRGQDLLAEFPEDHPFRLAASAPPYFTSGIDPNHVMPLQLARLYANWYSGAVALPGGMGWLEQLLAEKTRGCGGTVRLRERVDSVVVKGTAACGVRLDASGEEIGCNFVIAGLDLAELLRLLPERQGFEELFERIGEPQLSHYRYTLNLVLAKSGVPSGMARDVFCVRSCAPARTAEDVLHVQSDPIDAQRQLLCVEALLPRRQVEDADGYLTGMRERVLAVVGELVPFLNDHLLLLDSPHDGREPQPIQGKWPSNPTRAAKLGPQTMATVYSYPVTTGLGLCALPVRTPVRQLLLCNEQVVPGLGLEGLLLTAWSAARLVTRSDRSKERLCRGVWTKTEL